MLIKEFISEANKNQMISTLLQFYKVGNVRVKLRSMKDHAHYNVDTGTLELSTRYRVIKKRDIREFLVTMIHEIRHAMDAKKYGWRRFRDMYEMQIAQYQAENPGKEDDWYDYIPFETEAEKFGQRNYRKWFTKFKKQDLI